MQSIPVDTGKLRGLWCVAAPEPRVNTETGEVRKGRDGLPVWVVGVSVRRADTRKSSVIDVSVPGEPSGIVEGSRVSLADLEAVPWEIDGRHGVSYRASAITAAPVVSTGSAPSGGGTAVPSRPTGKGGDA